MSAEIKSLIQRLPISSSKAYGKAIHEILMRLNNEVGSFGQYWTKTGNNVWNTTENIGIGTNTPDRKLEILDEFLFTHYNIDNHIIGVEMGDNVTFPSYALSGITGISRYYTGLTTEDVWSESVINPSSADFGGNGNFNTFYKMTLAQVLAGSTQNFGMDGTEILLQNLSNVGNQRASEIHIATDNINFLSTDPTDTTQIRSYWEHSGYLTQWAQNSATNEINTWELGISATQNNIIDSTLNEGKYIYGATSAQWSFTTLTEFLLRQASVGTGIKDTVSTIAGTSSFDITTDRGDGLPGLRVGGVSEFLTNGDAVTAGLSTNVIYHTAGVLKIVQ